MKTRCCCATSSISTRPMAAPISIRPRRPSSRRPRRSAIPMARRPTARTSSSNSRQRPRQADGEAGEGEEAGPSLAAMEAQLKPDMLAIFDSVADIHKKLNKIQDQRIAAIVKGTQLPRATERRYDKLKDEVIELLRKVRFNNTRIEHLVEQLYELNRRLVTEEGRMLRAPASAGGQRAAFLPRDKGDGLSG